MTSAPICADSGTEIDRSESCTTSMPHASGARVARSCTGCGIDMGPAPLDEQCATCTDEAMRCTEHDLPYDDVEPCVGCVNEAQDHQADLMAELNASRGLR